MKPTRNRVMCPDCGRQKMLFKSEAKAKGFIKWNGRDLPFGGDRLRPYYCPACCGWHISHMEHKAEYDVRTEMLLNKFRKNWKNYMPFWMIRNK